MKGIVKSQKDMVVTSGKANTGTYTLFAIFST